MIIIGGTKFAGRVDEVPGGLFYVVTKFEHLFYVPIIPQASFVVLHKTPEGGIRGGQVPLNFKSILMAWLRAFLIFVLIMACIFTGIGLSDMDGLPGFWVAALAIGVSVVVLLVLTYRLGFLRHASYQRALALARQAGLDELAVLSLEVSYGRKTAAEAEKSLAQTQPVQQPTGPRTIKIPAGFLRR